MDDFYARLPGITLKLGADLGALQLLVLVIRISQERPQHFNASTGEAVHMQLGVIPGLLQIDADIFFTLLLLVALLLVAIFLMIFVCVLVTLVVVLFMVTMGTRRNSILSFQVAHRETGITSLTEVEAESAGDIVEITIRIGNIPVAILQFFFFVLLAMLAATQLFLCFQGLFINGLARDVEIIVIASSTTQMPGKLAVAGIDTGDSSIHVCRIVIAILHRTLHAIDGGSGYTTIDDIDHAANSAASIE